MNLKSSRLSSFVMLNRIGWKKLGKNIIFIGFDQFGSKREADENVQKFCLNQQLLVEISIFFFIFCLLLSSTTFMPSFK